MGAPPLVELAGVERSFDGRVVLSGIDLTIAAGSFVTLVGRSGCGKSTLLKIVGGLDKGSLGKVSVPTRRAIVFQDARLLPWKRVWRNVMIGLEGAGAPLRRRALAALSEVGLAERIEAWPLTLSGGEAQRVALARALVRTPDLLLLDEPFASLDALTRLQMQGQIAELWRRHGMAILLVTHDVDEALLLADRVVLIDGGRIASDDRITLPRPRHRDDPAFGRLRRDLLARLGVVEDAWEPPAGEVELDTPARRAAARLQA